MSKAFVSINRGLHQAIAHQKGKVHGVKTHAPSTSKRNIGEEIIESFEPLKAWRRGELKLRTHVVEMPRAANVPTTSKRTKPTKRWKSF